MSFLECQIKSWLSHSQRNRFERFTYSKPPALPGVSDFYNDGFVNFTGITQRKSVPPFRTADNPQISKSIGLGRATTCGSPRCLANTASFLGRGGFSLACCRAYIKSPKFPLRLANAGVGVCREKVWPGFRGNLGGRRAVTWRGRGFWDKCEVVGNGERPQNKNMETGTAEMAGVESRGRIAAFYRLLVGVAVFGRNAGMRIAGKAAEKKPGNRNCGNGRHGQPRTIAAVDRCPEGVAVLGCVAGLWLAGKAAEQMPGNRNCGNGWRGKPGRTAAVDRLPEGVAGVAVLGRNTVFWIWGKTSNKSWGKSGETGRDKQPGSLAALRLS